jgi:hypothetical protein
MAWSWGASRLLDVLQESGQSVIDPDRVGVTGCSRNDKGAFTVGVFDERIALTIPQETSTGGLPAYRIVDVLPGAERTNYNFFGLNWLSNDFQPFVERARATWPSGGRGKPRFSSGRHELKTLASLECRLPRGDAHPYKMPTPWPSPTLVRTLPASDAAACSKSWPRS